MSTNLSRRAQAGRPALPLLTSGESRARDGRSNALGAPGQASGTQNQRRNAPAIGSTPTFHRGLRLRFVVERPRLPFADKQRAPSGGTRLGLNKVGPRGKGWS